MSLSGWTGRAIPRLLGACLAETADLAFHAIVRERRRGCQENMHHVSPDEQATILTIQDESLVKAISFLGFSN
jgi:hypothetical protein